MNRRRFIQQTTATAALAGISGFGLQAFSSSTEKKITILHTNDVHSHIDPFGPNDGRNANKGGVARRATLVEQIRKENPNTLLFDAGDIFQGTPYFNYYGGSWNLSS
jgi:5'-nucleotidase